nr:amino acid adenylation domain-containing protein [Segniliparus rotundus]
MISLEKIRHQVAGVLAVPPDSLATDADLISLGLDSIRMMSLAGAWRKQGVDVAFGALAAAPTLAGWHALLQNAPKKPSPAVRSSAAPVQAGELASAGKVFPLAAMQHAQWVGRDGGQRLGGVAAHLYVEFDGAHVDPARLKAAVDLLVQRHPMLRVQILPEGAQRVLPAAGGQVFAHEDLGALAEHDAQERLELIREQKSHQHLAVHEGQVFDVLLVSLPDGRSRLCLDVDMIAADAMSYRVLVADLAALYRGERLEPLSITFQEHLERKRAVADSREETDRAWWAERLAALPPPPELPVLPEAESGLAHSPRATRRHYWLSPQRKQALFERCRSRGVTPAMALASIFATAIGNWSANPKFLLNLPLFTRDAADSRLDRVVGDFTSSVMLSVDLAEPQTVGERACSLQQSFHEAAAHSAYSGLNVLRDLSRLHGEQILAPVVYTSAIGLGELFAQGVAETFGKPVHVLSQGPQVALDAQVTEIDGGLLLNWDVREPLLRPGVVEAMFAWYTAEIERLATDPEQWAALSGQGALPARQREVREALRASAPASDTQRALHTGFFENAERNPGAVAVIAEDGSVTTYAELRRQALAVAGALAELGVRRGEAVAVALAKGAAQIPVLLGVLASGGVYVPVGVDQPQARRQQIARTARIAAVIAPDDVAAASVEAWAGTVPAVSATSATEHPRPLPEPVAVTADDLAYVLFTSGSTGEPKGVELRHGAPMNTIAAVVDRFGITETDRCLSLSPLECDWSVFDIFGMFSVGGSVVVIEEASRQEPALWAQLMRTHEVTYIGWMPGWLDLLLDASSGDLPSLRVALAGGDWVSADLPRRLRVRAPQTRFAGLGGATETAIHSTVFEVPNEEGSPPAHWRAIPFGRPLAGVRCRVVNPRGEDCPDWVPGEYWVGGAGIAEGYRGDPERTEQRFVQYQGERWYRTGDLVRCWPDGVLEFVGRMDHRIKVRGYGVELGEVETALRRIPGVARAVVVPLEGVTTRLVGAVSVEAGADLDANSVRAALGCALPAHMVPDTVVLLEAMPLTAVGKLDRAAVRKLVETAAQAQEGVSPRTSLEAALVRILGEVVGGEIGVLDDFFSFGVDSILAIKAVSQIRDWLDSPQAAVADFFAARTVAGLAERLQAKEAEPGRLEKVAEVYLEVAAMPMP